MLGECWAPWHTGPRTETPEAPDEWVTLDSVVMHAGARSARQTEFRATELRDIMLCPACLAHPLGLGLVELFTDPSAAPVGGGATGTEPDKCTVTCMAHRPNRRRLLRIKAHKGAAYCPGCGGNARIAVYQGQSRPRWRDILRESFYDEVERWEERHELRVIARETAADTPENAPRKGIPALHRVFGSLKSSQ